MAARRVELFFLFALLGVLSLIAGLGWGALEYTSRPAFCNSCHVMNTRFVSWQRSPHAGHATCIQCHSDPGTWEELKAHLNGLRYLYVMLTGEMTGPILKAEVSDSSCQSCHQRERLPDVVRTHKVSHGKHLAAGLSCGNCHAGVVHGSLDGGPSRPVMQLCTRCHATSHPILASCQSCHVQGIMGVIISRLRR
jgi:nitrate/TMAO reductase-like tetraheme cytochrome c subunit